MTDFNDWDQISADQASQPWEIASDEIAEELDGVLGELHAVPSTNAIAPATRNSPEMSFGNKESRSAARLRDSRLAATMRSYHGWQCLLKAARTLPGGTTTLNRSMSPLPK